MIIQLSTDHPMHNEVFRGLFNGLGEAGRRRAEASRRFEDTAAAVVGADTLAELRAAARNRYNHPNR